MVLGVLGQLGPYLSEVSLKPPPLPPLAERVATDVYRSMPIVNGMDSSDTECGT